MKIKKLLLPFFAVLLSTVLLTGCSKPESGKKEASTKTEEAKDKEAPEKKDEENSVPEKDKAADTTETSEMGEQVLFDNDKLRLTIKGTNLNDLLGPSIQISIENKTDQAQTYILNHTSVNGYMMNGVMYEEVQAKSSKDGSITFSSQNFEEAGITSMDEVILSIKGYISDVYTEDGVLVNQEFSLYPTGKSPDSLDFPKREAQSTDEVLVDENGLKVVVVGLNPDHFMGQELKFYVENNTDQVLDFFRSKFVVNGKSLDAAGTIKVAPGKKAYTSVYLFSENLEISGIKDITDLRFNVKIMDPYDWLATPILEKDFEYKVK